MLTEKEIIQQIKLATLGTIMDTGVNLGDKGQGGRLIYECIGKNLWLQMHIEPSTTKPGDILIAFRCEMNTDQVLGGFKHLMNKSKITFKQK